MVHFRGGRAAIDIESYPNIEDFFEDLAKVYREEIKALYDAGARYIQLDDTNLACESKQYSLSASRRLRPARPLTENANAYFAPYNGFADLQLCSLTSYMFQYDSKLRSIHQFIVHCSQTSALTKCVKPPKSEEKMLKLYLQIMLN